MNVKGVKIGLRVADTARGIAPRASSKPVAVAEGPSPQDNLRKTGEYFMNFCVVCVGRKVSSCTSCNRSIG